MKPKGLVKESIRFSLSNGLKKISSKMTRNTKNKKLASSVEDVKLIDSNKSSIYSLNSTTQYASSRATLVKRYHSWSQLKYRLGGGWALLGVTFLFFTFSSCAYLWLTKENPCLFIDQSVNWDKNTTKFIHDYNCTPPNWLK